LIGGAASDDQAIVFAPFSLLTQQQLLLEEGRPVGLGSRALDILTVLARRAGEVVSKEELIAQVWPGIFVEEGTLRVHIAALRRALGDGQVGRRFIVTMPGRGYSLVAPVSRAAESPPPGQREVVPAPRGVCPRCSPRCLGEPGWWNC
jgi:DNA-binding winged helix-turn-helix (wHTH) protein